MVKSETPWARLPVRGDRRLPFCGSTVGGFSYLELVIVVIIISVLLVVLGTKFMAMQVDAERAAMDNVLGSLRSAVGIKVAEYLARDDMTGIRGLAGTNPMRRLAELPKNYLGEIDPATTRVEGGEWYFDVRTGYLVYTVRNADHFQTSLAPPARARFVLKLVVERDGKDSRARPAIAGVRLVPVEPYRWVSG